MNCDKLSSFILSRNVVYLLTSHTNGILVPHCVLMSMLLVLALIGRGLVVPRGAAVRV